MTSRFSMTPSATFAPPRRMHSRGGLAPNLGEALRPAAAPFVVLVTHRILVVIILVVVLGRIEGRGWLDLRDHRLFEFPGDLLLRGLGQLLFLIVAEKDHALISAALVAELPVRIERVDIAPEMVE